MQIRPRDAELHNNLGSVLLAQERLAEAESSWRQVLQIEPEHSGGHYNLGIALQAQGRLAESEASYRRALQISPEEFKFHNNLLMNLNYQACKSNEEIFGAHREFETRFGKLQPKNSADPRGRLADLSDDPRLRVGYVSPDFRQHSIAHFIAPLLQEHDRRRVEVFCYAEVGRPDAVTSRLQSLADHWLGTVGLTDAELAERIAKDRVDILVDLSGHTAGNRLLVFARKPAPIQVTWLGYPNTTGLSAMDYRLVDAVTDPVGEADRWANETLVRLDEGFLCFEAPPHAPVPRVPDRGTQDTVTFGSFNNPAKLSGQTLDAWIAILARVTGSRLLLKGVGFKDELTRQQFLTRFGHHGGNPQQVVLHGTVDRAMDHLSAYHQVDIALDPFPYNGTATTCEALWMGVPVVTLLGNRHAARVGASLLTQVGLTDLIAQSVEDYVDIAATLAANHRRLSALRQELRVQMQASSLCDARSFSRKIEATYRELWRRYCDGRTTHV